MSYGYAVYDPGGGSVVFDAGTPDFRIIDTVLLNASETAPVTINLDDYSTLATGAMPVGAPLKYNSSDGKYYVEVNWTFANMTIAQSGRNVTFTPPSSGNHFYVAIYRKL